MHIDVLTLFPEMFEGIFGLSIMKRAIDRKLVAIGLHNIRDYTHDKHHTADDYPYGGGAGMVLKPEPIFEAVEAIEKKDDTPIILLSPQGRLFTQDVAQ
ncbi:MAG TPA: tRNA (guanosine(37)-N1)-methyltransferase TrmD, partial [Dehalococcoidales bacterium]|nr:tRNA (guanosine(37)-N1)-methyltransferase TrmD [Dehalococcoidales bacterium]